MWWNSLIADWFFVRLLVVTWNISWGTWVITVKLWHLVILAMCLLCLLLCGCDREGSGTNHRHTLTAGWPVCQALMAYEHGQYSESVDHLLPAKYNVSQLGGSNAQVRVGLAWTTWHASFINDVIAMDPWSVCEGCLCNKKTFKLDPKTKYWAIGRFKSIDIYQ